jgi:hypothetical protein
MFHVYVVVHVRGSLPFAPEHADLPTIFTVNLES